MSRFARYFMAYHPYLTFSNPLKNCFVGLNGERQMDDDLAGLLLLGREAFAQLPVAQSEKEFDVWATNYFNFIEECRLFMKGIVYKWECGSELTDEAEDVDWDVAPDYQILTVMWRDYWKPNESGDLPKVAWLKGIFLIQALVAIDEAIFWRNSGPGSIASAIEAANALAIAAAIELGSEVSQEAGRRLAYKGAIARKDRDPKQKDKKLVFECWEKWQESPTSYPSKAAFARDMLDKCEFLVSNKKIEDWCREWGRKK